MPRRFTLTSSWRLTGTLKQLKGEAEDVAADRHEGRGAAAAD